MVCEVLEVDCLEPEDLGLVDVQSRVVGLKVVDLQLGGDLAGDAQGDRNVDRLQELAVGLVPGVEPDRVKQIVHVVPRVVVASSQVMPFDLLARGLREDAHRQGMPRCQLSREPVLDLVDLVDPASLLPEVGPALNEPLDRTLGRKQDLRLHHVHKLEARLIDPEFLNESDEERGTCNRRIGRNWQDPSLELAGVVGCHSDSRANTVVVVKPSDFVVSIKGKLAKVEVALVERRVETTPLVCRGLEEGVEGLVVAGERLEVAEESLVGVGVRESIEGSFVDFLYFEGVVRTVGVDSVVIVLSDNIDEI